jgi:hypothetical protein
LAAKKTPVGDLLSLPEPRPPAFLLLTLIPRWVPATNPNSTLQRSCY